MTASNNGWAVLPSANWNGSNVQTLMRNNSRTSTVPAPAVTPTRRVYANVVAVEKLVVGIEKGGGMVSVAIR